MKRVIVDNLKIQNNELVCKDKTGRYQPVFKKQGDLDGACATYSVIMNLLILGVITEKETHVNEEHKTRDTRKLFKVFCNDYGMHRNGQTYYKITRMLKEGFSNVITPDHKITSDIKSVEIIKETIDDRITQCWQSVTKRTIRGTYARFFALIQVVTIFMVESVGMLKYKLLQNNID